MAVFRLFIIISLITFVSFKAMAQYDIFINEFMSSNGSTIADKDGDFEDWVEIYNASANDVDITGFYLSDRLSNTLRWQFPTQTIEAGGYLLVFASGKDLKGEELHTNFKISSSGEPLILSDALGNRVDFIGPVSVPRDNSYGRYPDGSESFITMETPTPGMPNYDGFRTSLKMSVPSGFYEQPFQLKISSEHSDDIEIFYTTNGNRPDRSSEKLSGPIEIKSSSSLENNPIIFIPTNAPSSSDWYRWRTPREDLFKANVVRALAFKGNNIVSEEIFGVYFVDNNIEERFSLPVISIQINEDALYDHDTGLFVPGAGYEENPLISGFWSGGNFHNRGEDWERSCNFTFFDEEGDLRLDQVLGIRIHGSASRSLPLKSLRLYARNKYGQSTLDYRFFDSEDRESFKRLLLRNGGQGFMRSLIEDGLTHEIIAPLNVENQAFQPMVLFINGAYWGIVNMREHFNRHYFERKYGIDRADLEIIEHTYNISFDAVEGTNDDYVSIIEFLENNSIESSETFNWISSQIDINDLIDYHLAKMFFGVKDWPANNTKFWRSIPNSPKWKYLFFDNDDAFQDKHFNSFEYIMDTIDQSWPKPLWSTLIFRRLIEYEDFRLRFLERLHSQLNYVYNPGRTVPIADRLVNTISSEIPYHIDRWRFPQRVRDWERQVDRIYDFLFERPCLFRNMILDYFGIDYLNYPVSYCDLDVFSPNASYIYRVEPNPATDIVKITFAEGWSSVALKLWSMDGKLVYSDNVPLILDTRSIEIPVFNLSSGVYVLSLLDRTGEMRTSQLVIH